MSTRLLLSAAFMVLMALGVTLLIKSDVRSMNAQKEELIERKQRLLEDQRVLKAEYAYLSRPARLKVLAGEMGLKAVTPDQIEFVAFAGGMLGQ